MPDYVAFERELAARLAAPVNKFYDVLEASAETQGTIGGFVQSLVQRLQVSRARAVLRAELRYAFEVAYQYAGNLGNNEQPMDAVQHREVLARLADGLNYLDGFLAAVQDMSRAQALARILKYAPPILQTVSRIAASDLPTLPIYPGDDRLDCVRKAHGIRVCRCHLDIKRIGPNSWDVFWRRDAAESCESCKDLEKSWAPLRIRNGRILPPTQKALKPVEKSLGNTGAMIALYPPVNLASDLERIAASAFQNAEKADDLHTTLLFLGDADQLTGQTDALRVAVERFASDHAPIAAQLNGTARFDSAASDDGTPFVALVDSPQLPAFRQELLAVVKALGVNPVQNHGFIPHMTLAYMPNGEATPTLFLPTGSALVFEKLSLVIADTRIDFPFGSPGIVTVAGMSKTLFDEQFAAYIAREVN